MQPILPPNPVPAYSALPLLSEVVLILLLLAVRGNAAELKPKTVAAYENYLAAAEKQIDEEQSGASFFWGRVRPEEARLRAGEILVQKAEARHAPNGLIHHWTGFIFVPQADLQRLFALLQDYDHHANYYKPEVARSKLLQRDGDHFLIYLRFVKKKVITVVLDTDHDVRYMHLDAKRAYSRSHTTRVAEVESANQPDERTKPVGQGGGYMWRMDTYWRFVEQDGGVYIRCDAISLTRDIPTGLGWLIGPFISSIPKDSLFHTLNATRVALQKPQP